MAEIKDVDMERNRGKYDKFAGGGGWKEESHLFLMKEQNVILGRSMCRMRNGNYGHLISGFVVGEHIN